MSLAVGQVTGDWQISGQWVHPCDPAYDLWFERQVVDALSLLTAGGARVALALPAPAFGLDFIQRTACIRADQARAVLSLRGVSAIDFKALVCPQKHCVKTIDGITLREDSMHYEGPAAELVVRWWPPVCRPSLRFRAVNCTAVDRDMSDRE